MGQRARAARSEHQRGRIGKHLLEREIGALAEGDLDHIVKGVYATCNAQQEVIQEGINHSLAIAEEVLTNAGGTHIAQDAVDIISMAKLSGFKAVDIQQSVDHALNTQGRVECNT